MNLVFFEKDGDSEIKVILNLDDGTMTISKPTRGMTPALKRYAEIMIEMVTESQRNKMLEFVNQADMRQVIVGKELCG